MKPVAYAYTFLKLHLKTKNGKYVQHDLLHEKNGQIIVGTLYHPMLHYYRSLSPYIEGIILCETGHTLTGVPYTGNWLFWPI